MIVICYRKMNVFIIVATCLMCGVWGGAPDLVHPHDNFYPFGPSQGDVQLHRADDGSSNRIHLGERLVFFDGSYHSIWVSKSCLRVDVVMSM